MKPQILNLILILSATVFMFIFSSILLSLYLIFYEWMKEAGFSFWQFVFVMAGTATLLSLPTILNKGNYK
jgi:hypothetical protein